MKTFTVTDTPVLSVSFNVDSHQPTVSIFGDHACSNQQAISTEALCIYPIASYHMIIKL